MPIRIQCPAPACGATISAPDAADGRGVKCPRCGAGFVARSTLDGRSADTSGSTGAPGPTGDPFPALPAEFGRYRVLQKLGQGGMGAVYRARDTQLGRDVALKLPFIDGSKPHRVERFAREARAAAALHHPNICTVFDFGQIAGRPFLTMALVKGTPLDRAVDPDAPMNPARAAAVVRKAARALAYAHENGVVHRDLKPANIMLTAGDEPVVMDFGLAKQVSAKGRDESRLTADGGILGTPTYMAPEQATGDDAAIGPRTDVYALGVVLFELLAGEPPYTGSLGAVLGQIVAAPVPSVRERRPEVPAALDAICRRALAKAPGDRFPDMTALADALEAATGEPAGDDGAVELVEVAAPAPAAPAELAAAFEVLDAEPPARGARPRRRANSADPTTEAPALARRPPLVTPVRVAIAAAVLAVPLLAWLAATVLRLETPNGTLVVEIDDPAVEARIKGGKLVLSGPDGKDRYTLTAADRDKKIDAGAYRVRVEGADGLVLDTPEFTLTKGGKVTVRVTVDPKAVAKADPPKKDAPGTDPDRRAAEYALAVGGQVWIGDEYRHVPTAGDLPKEPFQLTAVVLSRNPKVNDAGLAAFRGCKHVKKLELFETGAVTDAGLNYFKDCRNIEELHLQDQGNIGDAGLAAFEGCTKVRYLRLLSTKVTDKGLAHFKDCKGLEYLGLGGTLVTDAGLAHFNGLKALTGLDLNRTRVTDVGLANFKDCKGLTTIGLATLPITDQGLAHFKGCSVTDLFLDQCSKVTDAGVSHLEFAFAVNVQLHDTLVSDTILPLFKNSVRLQNLGLGRTKVTAKGVEYIKNELPKCRVVWESSAEPVPAGKTADGFVPLFNGRDLTGWVSTAGATSQWKVTDGVITGSGPTDYLVSERGDFEDFHLRAEVRVNAGGNSGIYFRSPKPSVTAKAVDGHYEAQVTTRNDQPKTGSLFGLVKVDDALVPANTWFTYEIVAEGARVRLFVNGKQTADYTDTRPGRPRKGHIALQCWKHPPDETVVSFRKIEIKEMPPVPAGRFVSLFNGKDLTGWTVDSGPAERWKVENGYIQGTGGGSGIRGWLLSEKSYGDFELQLEFQAAPGSDGAVGIYALPGDRVGPLPHHLAIKTTNRPDPKLPQPGALYYWPNTWQPPSKAARPVAAGGWNKMTVRVLSGELRVSINGDEVQKLLLADIAKKPNAFPGASRTSGRVGLQQHTGEVRFRNIEIKELPPAKAAPDPFPVGSVWSDGASRTLTVTGRTGDAFTARFVLGANIERNISGTVKDGKVIWLAKDVKAVKGAPGHDNEGTFAAGGEILDFVFRDPGKGTNAGTFTLRRQPGK